MFVEQVPRGIHTLAVWSSQEKVWANVQGCEKGDSWHRGWQRVYQKNSGQSVVHHVRNAYK